MKLPQSIRARTRAAFAVLLCLIAVTAGAGIWASFSLSRALQDAGRASELLRNHVEADMMHDALRADVLAALLTTKAAPGIDLAEVKTDLADHAQAFRAHIASAKALATPAAKPVLAALDAPLAAYISSAERMVGLAASQPDAMAAGMPAFMESFAILEKSMSAASDVIGAQQAAGTKKQGDATSRNAQIVLVAALIAGLLLVAALLVLAERGLVRPLTNLTESTRKLAAGDNTVEVPGAGRTDEIGDMAGAVQTFKEAAIEKIRLEGETTAARIRAEEAQKQAEAEVLSAERAAVAGSIGLGLESLAQGDLTYRLPDTIPAEYAKLRTDFNEAMLQLQETMKTVTASTEGIRSGTTEITQASDDLARRTEQQAASLEETAAALDEITATVRKTAEGSNHAREVVATARTDAETSGRIVSDAVAAMHEIEQSSQQISQIIGVIDEIAFQTNLLALNAGVEAARAGDAGRGFAVVASEVRALAQRSADAAKEIKTLISASGQQVSTGVDLVGQTGEALNRIVTQVAEISGVVIEIAASAQEQAVALQQVNTAVNQMDQVTQQNAAMVEQATAASHSLAQETQELAKLISKFQVGTDTSVSPVRQAQRPAARSTTHTALKTVAGPGGAAAARKPAPVGPDADDWQEF